MTRGSWIADHSKRVIHIYIVTQPPALSASKVGIAQLEYNAHILSNHGLCVIPKISTEHFDADSVRGSDFFFFCEQLSGEQISGEQMSGEQLSGE